MQTLSVAFGDYPHVASLVAGEEQIPGYEVRPVQVDPIISAYRRMVRDLEFDVCELAPVTYLMARENRIPIVAIPAFLNRKFHHQDINCGPASGVHRPKDLEGKDVGVRAYSVSTGVWGRGLLAQEYSVDLSTITWVVDDDDHIAGKEPPNQRRETQGRSLRSLMMSGEIAAAFGGNAGTGRAGAPRAHWTDVQNDAVASGESYPLFPDAPVLESDWYLRTGVYPLHSIVVIRAELVEADPDLPTKVYSALRRSKDRYTTADPAWARQPSLARQSAQVHGDPLPYGLDTNAKSMQTLLDYSANQGLIASTAADTIYAPGDYAAG